MRPRIVIADDHELVREGLRRVLSVRDEWEICGEASDGRELVELVGKTRPHVAIVDFGMPRLNGFDAACQIIRVWPSTEVLMLTMHETEQLIRDVLRSGIRGFILKSDAGQLLVQAVETLLRHRPFFTGRVSEMVLQGYLDPSEDIRTNETGNASPLTAREREIVQLVAEGKSSKEVAETLGISVRTAETHRANILRKLGLRTAIDIVRYAVRNGIVTL